MISTASDLAAWLAEMSDDRERVFDDWRAGGDGMTVLAAGASWDAVRFSEVRGYRAYLGLLRAVSPVGPVLWDSWCRQVYFLTAPGWADLLRALDVRVVSRGGWLAVPDPRLQVGRFVWIIGSRNRRLTCPGRLYLSAVPSASVDTEGCTEKAGNFSLWVAMAARSRMSRNFQVDLVGDLGRSGSAAQDSPGP
ncbi:hypothetical protein [Streptomyces sp. NPDC002265]|uniref:hypothetical protein n=1 Tax=Streptomyces sp. NPDC002265 TaxID=3154415 RepID=UPI0033235612